MLRSTTFFTIPCLLALSSCGGTTVVKSGNAGEGGSDVGGGAGGSSSVVPCGKTTCPEGDVCCSGVCGVCARRGVACPANPCDPNPPPVGVDCNMFAEAPPVRSCMQAFGDAADASFGPRNVDLTAHGPVTSVGMGVVDGSCMADVIKYEAKAAELSAETTRLVVSDESRAWDVELIMPTAKLPDLKGAVVDVRYHYQFGGFGPTERMLIISGDSGQLVYQADAGSIEKLMDLPLPLYRGDAVCSTADMCGDWRRYNITVAGLGGALIEVPHGATQTVTLPGDTQYTVVHGGYAEQTSPNTKCADWFVGDVHVGMVRVPTIR